jgi:predicted HD phosphohydrolase
VQSRRLQGGPFADTEISEFEANPWYRDALALRRWDDLAKVPDMAVPDLAHYRARIAIVLRGRQEN